MTQADIDYQRVELTTQLQDLQRKRNLIDDQITQITKAFEDLNLAEELRTM